MPAPRGIEQQLDQFLHRCDFLMPGSGILVACSGGADSVALLRLLHAINHSDYWNWKLVVGHVNHQLRGEESDADEAGVRTLAQTLGLPFVAERLTLKKNRAGHVSEDTARAGRLGALRRMVIAERMDVVALGHHADDQAETVLLRVLRGASIHGLGAMAPRSLVGGIALIRPLLQFERADLHAYLRKIKQTWHEDRTNAVDDFLRNRIRHELLPLLEEYQPRVRSALVRLAEHARESDELLEAQVQDLMEREVARETDSGARLKRAMLKKAQPAVVGRLLQGMLVRAGARADGINTEQLRAASRAIRGSDSGSQFEFGGGVTLAVGREYIEITQAKAGAPSREKPSAVGSARRRTTHIKDKQPARTPGRRP